jgi:hypothetical protein
MAEAAVANGVHYVDMTGEPQYVLRLIHELDKRARDRGVAIIPGVAAMCVTGDLAAADAVARLGEPVASVIVGYRLPVLRPSPGTVSSYAHIFADGALEVRDGALLRAGPGDRIATFPSGTGFTTPGVDPVAISRWCDANEVGLYMLAPAAGVTRYAARGLSRMARLRSVRRGWEYLGRRVPAHPGDSGTERWYAEAVATGPCGWAATRVRAHSAYPFTSKAAALAAAAVTGGIPVAGVCGPSQVLNQEAATALGLTFEELDPAA